MKQLLNRFLILTLSVLLLVATTVAAGEKIPIKDLPEKVTKAIEARFPGAQLLSAEKEKDDGKIEYEVKIRHDGKKYEVELTEDGKIKEIEREDD